MCMVSGGYDCTYVWCVYICVWVGSMCVMCMWDAFVCVTCLYVCRVHIWGVHVSVGWRKTPMSFLTFYLDAGSLLFVVINWRLVGIWVSRESPVSSCHLDMGAKGFQIHRTVLSLWSSWGFELGSSCFHGKCFTNWTTSPALKQLPVPAFPWPAP